MHPSVKKSTDQIVKILRQCLEEGSAVEIDGLGVFRPGSDGYEFYPAAGQKVFIAYAHEDRASASRLYEQEGYLRVGTWTKYYNDGGDALVMEKIREIEEQ